MDGDTAGRHPARDPMLGLGPGALGVLAAGGLGAALLGVRRLNAIARFDPSRLEEERGGRSSPLFDRFPGLADRVPWRPLGAFPTPVETMPTPPGSRGVRLFVKRDDLASDLYGGNKVRKLEHFLAEASLASRRTLITLGGIGSNHALATAMHGAAAGFDVDLALYDQPVTPFVRRNLGGFLAAGARLHHAGSMPAAFVAASRLRSRLTREGAAPHFVMVGGTSRLGCLGYVSAGLELAAQVEAGVLPAPDVIFLPLGTCGTAAGLLVGLRLGGLASRVVAVRVADAFPANARVLLYFARDVADFLHAADPAVPRLRLGRADVEVATTYLGEGYGHPTVHGENAVRWAAPQLSLETTYSGKALAACIDLCRDAPPGSTALFWNTYSSASVPVPENWAGLPPTLRHLAEP